MDRDVSRQLRSRALLPAACACQEASSVQRSISAYLGVYFSPGPTVLILTCAGRITILAGTELAPTWHLFTPTRLPQGFAGGCKVQREGVFLRSRQVMCKMCSPPARSAALNMGSPCSYIWTVSVKILPVHLFLKGFFPLLRVRISPQIFFSSTNHISDIYRLSK